MTSTLFLDFASHQKMMGLVDDHSILRMETVEGRIVETDILPTMERVLGAPLSSIDGSELRIAAITGPGGFMSIRTGISIINTLAWTKKLPIAGIHGSDLWRTRVGPHPSLLPSAFAEAPVDEKGEGVLPAILWLHSTKRELFFIRGFGDFVKDFPESIQITLSDLQKLCDQHTEIPFVGEILDDQRTLLQKLLPIKDVSSLEEVLPSFLNSLSYDQKSLQPWYGRGA